jgi:hypothetical protein
MFQFNARTGGLAGRMLDLPREELFSVKGKSYTIPVDFPPTCAVGYATVQRRYGDDAALSWVLELALGIDGLEALTASDVTPEDLTKISAIIIGRVTGLAMAIPGPGSADGPKARTTPKKAAPRRKVG